MHRKLFIVLMMLTLFLVACSSDENPAPTGIVEVIDTQTTLTGSADIMFPQSGSIIYSETIFLEGTAENIPDEGFQVQLLSPDDSIIAEATVQPEEGNWFVEIVHEYSGDPIEVTIVAKSPNDDSDLDYDIESIILSSLDNRPEGVFGSITSPTNGMQVGGDIILVTGRASGIFENMFGLSIVDAGGEVVSEIGVSVYNPNFIDDMLWEAELPRNGFLGNGSIQITYQDMESGEIITMDSVNVIVSAIAG